jgi:diaminohydroxyphosphoribosylaminopyrimidine deaminase/5-amino-6-(5-phosphoribosylamino)uracil reductase
VVGRGFHERAGGPHAEAAALTAAGAAARGATAYVSLEPCAHHGRTPPCAEALIGAGVARVVSAHHDPNPQVAGQGLARMRSAGISTDAVDVDAARALNEGYFSRIERGRPWVRIKVGTSLDGRSAMASGESRWITGAAARADVQYWRARSCAILTGAGTVRTDDPQLTVRDDRFAVGGQIRQPLRVIAAAKATVPGSAQVFSAPGPALLAAAGASVAARALIRATGAEVLDLPADGAGVDLAALLQALGQRGCNELLVEAGARLTGALLGRGLWDELLVYVAPRLLGSTARPFADFSLSRLSESIDGRITDVALLDGDLRVSLRRR